MEVLKSEACARYVQAIGTTVVFRNYNVHVSYLYTLNWSFLTARLFFFFFFFISLKKRKIIPL
jgi:hypothetical protein